MIILSLFAFAIPLIPFGLLWQRTRQALLLSGRRSVAGDSESTHNLVLHNYPLGQNGSAEDGIDRINLGFLVLSLSTLVLSIASAGVEFAEINRARSTWDPSEASEVGLKWSIGGAAYSESESHPSRRQTLKPFLVLAVFPCVQLQAILAGTTHLTRTAHASSDGSLPSGNERLNPVKRSRADEPLCVETVQVPALGLDGKVGTRRSVGVSLVL
jgi:hypothetical protein